MLLAAPAWTHQAPSHPYLRSHFVNSSHKQLDAYGRIWKTSITCAKKRREHQRDGRLPFCTHPINMLLSPFALLVFPVFIMPGEQIKGWSRTGDCHLITSLLQTYSTSTGRRHCRADHHPLSQPFTTTFSRLSSCHYKFKI